ncbi:MAG: AI-2E family transporter [Clostridia bacterium]|nr:AI-2E family transporter [Clostridia bacterium]
MKRQPTKYFYISIYTILTITFSALIVYLIFNFSNIWGAISKFISIINPILIGFAIAYLINPVVNFFEKKVFSFKKAKKDKARVRRFCSVFTAYVLVLVILAALLWIIIPQVIDSVDIFVGNLSSYQRALEKWASSLPDASSKYYGIVQKFVSVLDEFVDMAVKYVTELVPKAFVLIKDVSVIIVNLILSIFVSIYMISRKEHLLAQSKKLICAFFNTKWIQRISDFMGLLDDSVGGFIKGKIIDSAIIGVLCYVVMTILRLDYSMLISVIVGITNVIPFFGPFIGAIPSAFILLMVNPNEVIPFLIAILLIQQLDGNFIGPKILGGSMGLSAFWILVAIVIMSGLFGFAGMIIGVPIFSVAYVLVERLVDKKLANKKMPVEIEEYFHDIPEPETETTEVKKD